MGVRKFVKKWALMNRVWELRVICSGLIIAGLIASCAPAGDSSGAPSPDRNTGFAREKLQGKISLPGAEQIDLADGSRPTVLIFASDFCAVCSEEARKLSQLFREKGGPPMNVRLLTILIGAVPEDVAPWVTAHGVSWATGFDNGDGLFRTYCPVTQTPCVLTHNPATGEIRTHNGHFSVSELEKETGKWVY